MDVVLQVFISIIFITSRERMLGLREVFKFPSGIPSSFLVIHLLRDESLGMDDGYNLGFS